MRTPVLVGCLATVAVAVGVNVGVGVLVAVGVKVEVAVCVAVGVGVFVGVQVLVGVHVGVGVEVLVGTTVFVGSGVVVGASTKPQPDSIMPKDAAPPSLRKSRRNSSRSDFRGLSVSTIAKSPRLPTAERDNLAK